MTPQYSSSSVKESIPKVWPQQAVKHAKSSSSASFDDIAIGQGDKSNDTKGFHGANYHGADSPKSSSTTSCLPALSSPFQWNSSNENIDKDKDILPSIESEADDETRLVLTGENVENKIILAKSFCHYSGFEEKANGDKCSLNGGDEQIMLPAVNLGSAKSVLGSKERPKFQVCGSSRMTKSNIVSQTLQEIRERLNQTFLTEGKKQSFKRRKKCPICPTTKVSLADQNKSHMIISSMDETTPSEKIKKTPLESIKTVSEDLLQELYSIFQANRIRFGLKANEELSSNRFFQNSKGHGNTFDTSAALNRLFDRYRGHFPCIIHRLCCYLLRLHLDDPTQEPDSIGVEGSMRYLGDLGVKLDEVVLLAVLTELSAPTMGELSRGGFLEGWKTHQ